MFVEVTTTAAVVVALTLAGFGFLDATEPRIASSVSLRERHLIGCPVCRDNRLPVEEQLRRCPGLAGLQRKLRVRDEAYPYAEEGPATAVAGRRLASDPGAEQIAGAPSALPAIPAQPRRPAPSGVSTRAYDTGTYSLGYDGPQGRLLDRGKYLVIWQQIDGEWKVMVDMDNRDLPSP